MNLRRRYKLKPLKFLISGGGTGGHIFPAIAIANEIKLRHPDAIIEFVGARDRMEMEKVPAAGYKITGIWITGFQRSFSYKNLLFPLKVISSIERCYRILKSFKPDVVIGTGGFASGPLLKVACWLNIPTLIQEQNSYAGVTNKLLGKKVSTICLGFEKAIHYFPKEKCVVTGNPVRQIILKLPPKIEALKSLNLEESKKTILIIGGSLGARSINQAIDGLMDKINGVNLQVIWQTGKNYEVNKYPKFGFVAPFIEHMEVVYSAADVIISRAGAIAITELCIIGKPVILIPSPNVAEDHQTKNALALVEKEAAILVKDKAINETLWPAILSLIHSDELAYKISNNIKALEKPDAAYQIVNEVLKLTDSQ
jgi:UDP-N-acetylglucosamine--N-acetylmuramyl-(pentapeptide) pyrophosphoryl-undecaprenol N-acetylglucosamine transferase